MPDLIPSSPAPGGEFLFYQTGDGSTRLQVRLEAETVWLTQAQMAELFQTTQQNVSLHLQNIFEEGELTPAATHKEFLSVRREGNRDVQRQLDYYNLDVIISVGYRVKSQRARSFALPFAVRAERQEEFRLHSPPPLPHPLARDRRTSRRSP